MPISNTQESFAWPPKCRLSFYDGRNNLLFSSNDRQFDLSDNLMLHWPHNSRTIYFGLSSSSTKWIVWGEEAIKNMECRINYDLSFDAYKVKITRLSRVDSLLCNEEFKWKLVIKATGFS